MGHFQSHAEVDHALEHYLLRPSKTTGRQLSHHTADRNRLFLTSKVKDLFCGNLRDGEFMRAVDRAFDSESKSHKTVGIVSIGQLANYYGIVNDEEYKWWAKEGNRRYKPNKTVAERIIPKDNLKRYFDSFLSDPPDHFTQSRLYLYSALLLVTGARQKSIINIKMSDFTLNESEMTLNIVRLKSAMSTMQTIHIPLDVPLPNGRPFAESLYQFLSLRLPNEYLFMDIEGVHGPGLFMSLMHQMRRQGHRAGIGHVTPHMFRFTCASIISDHVGLKQAQYLLGHADIKTTLRYANLQYENTSRASISNGFGTLSNSYAGAR